MFWFCCLFSLLFLSSLASKSESGLILQTRMFIVSWCFDPCLPERIESGLKTNFSLSPSWSAIGCKTTTFPSHYNNSLPKYFAGRCCHKWLHLQIFAAVKCPFAAASLRRHVQTCACCITVCSNPGHEHTYVTACNSCDDCAA